MNLPLLNRKLLLEDAVRTPDLAGGYKTEWQALGTLWAQIAAGTGRERGANGLALSRVALKITVRAGPFGTEARPKAGQRFREGTRIYAILAVMERDTHARFLTCQAEEEVAS